MNSSMTGFPVHHQLPELAQTQVHQVSDVIQASHPLSSSSPLALNPQYLPSSGFFPMSWLFASGGHSIGASALASVLPVNIQDWLSLGWTNLISLQSKALLRVFSNTTVQKYLTLRCSAFFTVQLSHPYMTTEKTIDLTLRIFFSKVISLLFNHCLGLS